MRNPGLRLAGLVLVLAGCRTPGPGGGSSLEFLTPVGEPAPSSEQKLTFAAGTAAEAVPPEAIGELSKPAYPPGALAAHPGTYAVNVTVTIDANGLVSEVRPAWNRFNPPNPDAEEFLAAIRAAAARWRFLPAKHVYWRQAASGEPVYDHADRVVCEVDLRFTFQPPAPSR